MLFKKNTGGKPIDWKFVVFIASIAMTIIYAIYITNVIYNYIPITSFFSDFINNCIYYGPISICAVSAVYSVSKKGKAVKITFIVVWVLIFLFSFFPNTFYSIIYGV